MKKKLLAVIFGATLVLGACGGGGNKAKDEKPANEGATSSIDAEAIVQKSCVSCHGGNLEGGMGPALDKIGGTLSEEEIHTVIVEGKGSMPAGIIKGEEADAVAKWLSEKK
ncbi:cytochrome c551 [Sporosarcina sp. G11-34]|uniref:cytochrome c551 n=1 Tax=Sporosarcina sp. G11-34 TaxID=2849605 RepID=UPI0022A9F196|nr:cytochrome c [Sporosarcina sp. G11-34]MCZ2257681.1 cytochrome c [Sporosarcina sp. G11-34]